MQKVLDSHNLGQRRQRVTALAQITAADHVTARLTAVGIERSGLLTDNGPDFTGRVLQDHLGTIGIHHYRIPPRSPNHSAVCGTLPRHRLH